MSITNKPPTPEEKAAHVFRRITSFSPRQELGGIDREWIEKKIAEGIQEYYVEQMLLQQVANKKVQ